MDENGNSALMLAAERGDDINDRKMQNLGLVRLLFVMEVQKKLFYKIFQVITCQILRLNISPLF